MRNFLRVLCVCALGVAPLVGCTEATECETDADCQDQNECTEDFCTSSGTCFFRPSNDWESCDDGDDNECLYGYCEDGVCTPAPWAQDDPQYDPNLWVENETPCESDGTPGVCVCGSCVVELPECSRDEECDDGNECTDDFCDFCTRSCDADTWYAECHLCDRNGGPGLCMDGVCEAEPECSADEECDDGIACTDDVCDDCYGCENVVNCWDDDECTDDRCDPDTGGCYYPPSPDGTYCECLEWEWHECWFIECLWGPGEYRCALYGHCQNGECV